MQDHGRWLLAHSPWACYSNGERPPCIKARPRYTVHALYLMTQVIMSFAVYFLQLFYVSLLLGAGPSLAQHLHGK
jgi:hypothetical protein